MASKRRQRKKACEGKRRFASVHEAERAMFALLKNRKNPTRLHIMRSYLCQFCKGYHFGHTPRAVRRHIRRTITSLTAP